ncbi:MAG: AsmA family protein, partial [Candidatus Competibacteraceae bacterium]|nr:AsmA family protein [Candidatus Competibacteraceae bacterium]
MNSALKWLLSILVVLALLAGGGYGFLHSSWVKDWLEDTLTSRLGQEVTISGSLSYHWGWPPGLTINGLQVANADWSQRGPLLETESVYFQLKPFTLFHQRPVYPQLRLTEPRLLLQRSEDGRVNWAFLTEGQEQGKLPRIRELEIEDGRLSYRAPGTDTHLTADISQEDNVAQAARAAAGDPYAFHLDGEGTLRGQQVTFSAAAGPLLTAILDREGDLKPYPVRGELQLDQATAAVEGTLGRPPSLTQLELDFTLEGPGLARLVKLTGFTVPDLPAGRITGHLVRNQQRWALEELDGQLGQLALAGQAELAREENRLEVDLSLGEATLQAQGRVENLLEPGGIDLTFQVSVPDYPAIAKLFGLPPGELRSYRLQGQLIRDQRRWGLRQLEGRLNQASIGGHAVLARAEDRLEVDLSVGEATLKAQGRLESLPLAGADLEFTLEVPNPASIEQLLQALPLVSFPLPSFAPYRISGRLVHQQQTYTLEELDGTIGSLALDGRATVEMARPIQARGELSLGDSDLSGQLRMDPSGPRPTIRGELSSQTLVVEQLAGLLGRRPGNGGGGVIPSMPIYSPLLRRFDAQLSYRADTLRAAGIAAGNLELQLDLQDGRLQLQPLALSLLEGRLRTVADLQGSQAPVTGSIEVDADGFPLEPFLAGSRLAGKVTGQLYARAELQGRGTTLEGYLAQADGPAALYLRQGRVDKELINKLGLD